MYSLVYSLTYLLVYSLTYSLMYSLTFFQRFRKLRIQGRMHFFEYTRLRTFILVTRTYARTYANAHP